MTLRFYYPIDKILDNMLSFNGATILLIFLLILVSKVVGINSPLEVFPGFFLKFIITLVSSSTLLSIQKLLAFDLEGFIILAQQVAVVIILVFYKIKFIIELHRKYHVKWI